MTTKANLNILQQINQSRGDVAYNVLDIDPTYLDALAQRGMTSFVLGRSKSIKLSSNFTRLFALTQWQGPDLRGSKLADL